MFDLYKGLTDRNCDIAKILECYQKYMGFVVDRVPSYKEFVQNLQEKMNDDEFLTDVAPLLRPDITFNPKEAYQTVYCELIDNMAGKRE